jgi:alginate O-acetyltransferase complex protein AlgI
MLFNSFPFLFLFLPLAVLGFFAAAGLGRGAARAWLVLASLAFYTWWHPPFTVLLLTSIIFNYAAGRLLLARTGRRGQGLLLAAAVGCNLAALFWYKYAYALASFLVANGVVDLPGLQPLLLPLGISFFTFTQIGFLVDCRGGTVQDRSAVDYLLFVTFFPHLIAGPILHHKEIMPQFARPETYRVDTTNLSRGAALFVIGLAKKVLIADPISAYAVPGFADPASLGLFAAWGAVLAYSLQLYFDFSGYSDMAIGIARMCNIRFPFNFNSPYRARNIIDFWQRWHMTLTRYLNLYLYNPLALMVTRRRAARGLPITKQAVAHPGAFAGLVAMPMVVTMALAGIWHGAGLQFLIFGLLHAVYLTTNHAWRVFGPRLAQTPWMRRPAWGLACLVLTYLCVLLAQIFFRASSTNDALTMLAGMVGVHGPGAGVPVPYWLPAKLGETGGWLQAHGLIAPQRNDQSGSGDLVRELLGMAVAYVLVFVAPNSQQIAGVVEAKGARAVAVPLWLRLDRRWGVLVGLVAVAAIMGIGAKSEFLYFQF